MVPSPNQRLARRGGGSGSETKLCACSAHEDWAASQEDPEQMDCKTTFSIGAGVFTDEDFERAAKEVLDPDINGWEFFVESRGTKIYRNYKEVGPGAHKGT